MENRTNNYKPKKKEISLLGLFGKEKLEAIQKKFAEATNFSFSIIDFKGEEVSNSLILNNYCPYKKSIGACEGCRMATAFGAAKAAFTNNPYLFECEQGLVQSAIPIIVNNQYLGAVLCGWVRCSDKENLPDAASHVQTEHRELDSKSSELYHNIPEYSCKKIRAVSSLVDDYFKELCNKETYAFMLSDYEHKDIHLKDLRKKIQALNDDVKNAEEKVLRANILPQLLLNMLVTISNYAIIEEAEKTEEIIEDMAAILRYYTDYSQNRIPVSHEMKQIENYMNMVAGKYENRLKIHIQQKKESEKQLIPKLSLLPLAEYIVNFGILNNYSKGTFYLDTTYSIERCVITMQYEHADSDIHSMGYLNQSGHIMDETIYNEQLRRIEKRLMHEYGEDYSLKIQHDVIILDIPRNSGK